MSPPAAAVAITGGCQCGAVRYRLSAIPRSTLCHCRMCQKAVGNLFAALCMVPRDALAWTRGAPALYASSTVATRGFCARCGTPLTFAYDARDQVEVTTGSLDDPASFPATQHFGVESRLPWLATSPALPETRTDANADSPVNQPGFAPHQEG